MANLHEIKVHIRSIKETRQITSAMKLVSAARLKKARILLSHTVPYFDKVKETIADILIHSGKIESPFFDVRHGKESKKKGYVVLTGDRGFSGGYNPNIVKLAESLVKDNPEAVLYIAGRMGRAHFIKGNYNVETDFDYQVQAPTVYRAREIADMLIELFLKHKLDEIYLVYTLMKSSINLVPVYTKLLPLDVEALKKELGIAIEENSYHGSELIIYEPSVEAVLRVVISKYMKGILYGGFVEAFTSEQSARMTAMENATTNADKMLRQLSLSYNRARQAAITREISEIVGGTEALNKF
jgi:F-type H+-transporting ATPase subunit gamma